MGMFFNYVPKAGQLGPLDMWNRRSTCANPHKVLLCMAMLNFLSSLHSATYKILLPWNNKNFQSDEDSNSNISSANSQGLQITVAEKVLLQAWKLLRGNCSHKYITYTVFSMQMCPWGQSNHIQTISYSCPSTYLHYTMQINFLF